MLASGHTVADYQIVKPLGENQIFTSYQVTGPTGEAATLLLLDVEQLVDKKSRQAFIAQAQLLCGQSFPGIGSLLAADSNDEYSYCLYPLIAGTPLTSWLDKGFSIRESLELVRAIASSLSPAHESGLWHGALSPTTIFLDQQGVYLDQFALASLLPLDFNSGIDPRYSSPELVRGETLSSASDLYSLGVLLYRLLCGKEPFVGEEPFATAMLHLQQQADPLPSELSILQPLIDALLLPVPGDRWDIERLLVELDHWLQQPEIDLLSRPASTAAEMPMKTEPELPQEGVEEHGPTPIEAVLEQSDMSARIEQRLQQRAAALQQSAGLTPDHKRASSARISAIGQESYRKSQSMNSHHTQRSGGISRFALLAALGVVVGIAIYLLLFAPQRGSSEEKTTSSPELLAGLEQGSQQLATGDASAAEQTFSGLVQSYPMAPQPYNNLAAIAAASGNLEQARELLERAMATDRSYATIYRNLGTVYSEMARDSYGRALQLEKGEQVISLQLFGASQQVALNNTTEMVEETAVAAAPVVAAVDSPPVEALAETVASVVDTQTTEVAAATPIQPQTQTVTPVEAAESETVAAVTEQQLSPQVESAESFLQRWADAWSSQDVPAYLAFYAEEFLPSSGASREEWELQRQTRLTRPDKIDVSLEDFSLVRESGNRVQIEVTQNYQSDRYQDRTRKSFDLLQINDSWMITRERSLGRAR